MSVVSLGEGREAQAEKVLEVIALTPLRVRWEVLLDVCTHR
jgi:hypothetical protein